MAGCGIQPVVFTDSSVAGEAAPVSITGWDWDFGDGTGHTGEQNPTHTYASAGTYSVILVVTDSQGLTDTYTSSVKVTDTDCPPPQTRSEDNKGPPGPPRDGVDADIAAGDADGDGVPDGIDNCPGASNPDQLDTDGDFAGDACDVDIDDDGTINAADNCVLLPNGRQTDFDADGLGDSCDEDADGDNVVDRDAQGAVTDNCLGVTNADQVDLNGDGVGDACQGAVMLPVAGAGPIASSDAVATPANVPAATGSFPIGAALVVALATAAVLGGVLMVAVRRRQA